ncbi:MAG: hypothetical protein NT075_28385, partial [Chloroflexi bacterium]|nr:hypothetical protein [Chloroflexota bacterium]
MSIATKSSPIRQARKVRIPLTRLLLHAVMILISLAFLVPLAWVASTSLKSSGEVFITPVEWIPKHPRWSNYAEVFSR